MTTSRAVTYVAVVSWRLNGSGCCCCCCCSWRDDDDAIAKDDELALMVELGAGTVEAEAGAAGVDASDMVERAEEGGWRASLPALGVHDGSISRRRTSERNLALAPRVVTRLRS